MPTQLNPSFKLEIADVGVRAGVLAKRYGVDGLLIEETVTALNTLTGNISRAVCSVADSKPIYCRYMLIGAPATRPCPKIAGIP